MGIHVFANIKTLGLSFLDNYSAIKMIADLSEKDVVLHLRIVKEISLCEYMCIFSELEPF